MKTKEWRNTAPPWLRVVEYSLFVRNRYVFYYAISGKHVKIIHLAGALASPNHIGVVFIFGSAPKYTSVQKLLNECDYPLMTLHVDIPMRLIREYDTLANEKKRIERFGETVESLTAEIGKATNAIADGAIELAPWLKNLEERLAVLNRFSALIEELTAAQNTGADVLSNFGENCSISKDYDMELTGIAAKLYPFGIEANAPTEEAGKMLAIKKLADCARIGIDTEFSKRFVGEVFQPQMSFFSTEPGVQLADKISSYIDAALEKDGAICVRCFLNRFMAVPYGLYECNFYMFHLAAGIRQLYTDGYYWNDGIASHDTDFFARLRYYCQNMPKQTQRTQTIYRDSPKMQKMTVALVEIFGPQFMVKRWNLDTAILNAISWCWENLQEPLAVADPRWHELLWNRNDMVLRANAEAYYDFVMDVDARKRDLVSTRDIVKARYSDQQKLALYYKRNYVKGGAIGTFAAEEFYERVDMFMSREVCRECGRELALPLTNDVAYVCQSEDGTTIRFTQKEIKGLNKKLLGRYQEEYFCIPCLCEVLDTTADALYEKVHSFREQGCELF